MDPKINQSVKGFPVDQRPKVRPDQDIRRRFARLRVTRDAQGVARIKGRQILGFCGEGQGLIPVRSRYVEIHGQKRGIVDGDADLFNRGDKKVIVPLTLQDRREEPHKRRAADGGAKVEPGAVAGDAHVDLAAKGRVPQVNRRRAFLRGGPGGGGKRIGVGCCHAANVAVMGPGATGRNGKGCGAPVRQAPNFLSKKFVKILA